jgi:hypothetical protein
VPEWKETRGGALDSVRLLWTAAVHRIRAVRLGLWLLPLLTFASLYLYRPFVLGFYSDDWGLLLEATHHGGPFSLERFDFTWQTFARPLMNIQIWLASSILDGSAVAWHFLLLILVAITCLLLRKLILALGARPAVATLASTLWLLFPWALGYRVWPVCTAILFSATFFLAGSLALLKRRLWTSLAWYAASMLTYEAFYFAFLPLLLILAFSPETRRWALRRATPLLLTLQIGMGVLNRLAAHFAPDLGKSFRSDCILRFGWMVVRSPLTLSEGIAGGRVLGIITVLLLILFALVGAFRTKSRERRVSLLAAVIGFAIACFVLALAGYMLAALNTASRTFVCVDIWVLVILALAWDRPPESRRMKEGLLVAMTAVFLILGVSTVLQANLWQRLWTTEQTVLRAVPVEEVEATGPKAVIVLSDFPTVDGYPPFSSDWVLTNAVANGTSGLSVRRDFYPAGYGAKVGWDGEWLLIQGSKVRKASEVWLWYWPTGTFVPVAASGEPTNEQGL